MTPKEQAEKYCRTNNLPEATVNILLRVDKNIWPIFASSEKSNTRLVLKTGYYSMQGGKPKRNSYHLPVIKAATEVGVLFSFQNIAPRGGVLGERLTINF